jgi:Tubulin/FtsZ family, GTPase domain
VCLLLLGLRSVAPGACLGTFATSESNCNAGLWAVGSTPQCELCTQRAAEAGRNDIFSALQGADLAIVAVCNMSPYRRPGLNHDAKAEQIRLLHSIARNGLLLHLIAYLQQLLADVLTNIAIRAAQVGLGGGTGSSAAVTVCEAAKSLGICTVVFATLPFTFEGRRRAKQATQARDKLLRCCDTLVLMPNDSIVSDSTQMGLQDSFKATNASLLHGIQSIIDLVLVRLGQRRGHHVTVHVSAWAVWTGAVVQLHHVFHTCR